MKIKNNYLIKDETIIINRKLTELDIFVKDFLEVLKKHSDYLIVSGFVSISTGRIRGTEDIDVLMPLMSKEKFKQFKVYSLWFKQREINGWHTDPAKLLFYYVKPIQPVETSK